jgi:hypothetical protein
MSYYEIVISKHNRRAHQQIDNLMLNVSNGVFSFTIKMSDSNIVDLLIYNTSKLKHASGQSPISDGYIDRDIETRIFHGMIEKEAQDTPYGEVTISVIIKNNKPDNKTFNSTSRRRYKFNLEAEEV